MPKNDPTHNRATPGAGLLEAWHFIGFRAASGFLAATGLALLLYGTRDFLRYRLLMAHAAAGTLNLLFATLALGAFIRRCSKTPKPRWWFLPAPVILFLPFAQVPYKATWGVAALAFAVTSKKGYRAPLLLYFALFFSGLYLSPFWFYATTLRSDFFFYLHLASAAALIAWLPRAPRVLRKDAGPEPANRRARAAAAAALLAASVWILLGIKEGSRFPASPAALKKGAAFAVRPDATLVPPKEDFIPYLQDSASCGASQCHVDIYEQWLVSSHRIGSSTPPYRKIVEEFADRFGWEATSHCSACHSPWTNAYGIPDRPGDPLADRLRDEGISCQYCHAIKHTDPVAGNGNATGRVYSLFPNPLPVGEGPLRTVQRRFITADLYWHRRDYGKMGLDHGLWCGGCHRVDVPHKFTEGHTLILGDTWSQWTQHKEQTGLTCVDCHMPLTTYSSEVHARPDHRMFGINQAMRILAPPGLAPPKLLEKFDADAEAWLMGKLPVPPFEQLYLKLTLSKKAKAYIDFFDRPATVRVGVEAKESLGRGLLETTVTLVNQTGIHNFPGSPLDLMESWVEVTAADARGEEIFRNCPESGPESPGDENCYLLGGIPLDAEGKPIEKHHYWDAKSVKDKRIIAPGESMKIDYVIEVPRRAQAPIDVQARCLYRRYKKKIANWVYEGKNVEFPIVELSRGTISVGAPVQ